MVVALEGQAWRLIAPTAQLQCPAHCLPAPLPPVAFCPPQDFYSLTLDSMAEAKNDRLWFKTNMKLANLWVDLKQVRAGLPPAAAAAAAACCGITLLQLLQVLPLCACCNRHCCCLPPLLLLLPVVR